MSKRFNHLSPADRRHSNKKPIEKFFLSQYFLAVIFLFLVIAIAFPLMRSFSQRSKIETEIELMRQENEKYRNKSAELREMIDYLQSESSLEEQARLNLGLKKSNEEVVVISQISPEKINTTSTSNNEQENNLLLWLKYFFK